MYMQIISSMHFFLQSHRSVSFCIDDPRRYALNYCTLLTRSLVSIQGCRAIPFREVDEEYVLTTARSDETTAKSVSTLVFQEISAD